jgi:hypothetical protein
MSFENLGQPDLTSLRATADGAEIAEAASLVRDSGGHRLADGHPLAPLAHGIARSLVEAGFTMHHCDQHHPLYRLGGVCLMAIAQTHGDGRAGIVVSWTCHNLLSLDWDRFDIYCDVNELMNWSLCHILRDFGYLVQEFGTGGAWLVTGERDLGEEAEE